MAHQVGTVTVTHIDNTDNRSMRVRVDDFVGGASFHRDAMPGLIEALKIAMDDTFHVGDEIRVMARKGAD